MCTNKIEISVGETPLILDACEMVAGRIFLNFSFDSKDKDLTLSLSKLDGIFIS